MTLLEQLRDQAAHCRAAGSALTGDQLDGATPGSPLARLSLEPQSVSRGQAFLVELTTWPGGRHEVLATAHGHGPPVGGKPLDT